MPNDPPSTLMLAGTDKRPLFVHNWTTTPPAGDLEVKLMTTLVFEELATGDGFTATEARATGAETVRVVMTLFPFRDAVIVPCVVVAT